MHTLSLSHALTLSLNLALKHSLSHSETGLAAHLRALFVRRERISLHIATANTGEIQAAFAFELRTAKGHARAVLLRRVCDTLTKCILRKIQQLVFGRQRGRGRGQRSGKEVGGTSL